MVKRVVAILGSAVIAACSGGGGVGAGIGIGDNLEPAKNVGGIDRTLEAGVGATGVGVAAADLSTMQAATDSGAIAANGAGQRVGGTISYVPPGSTSNTASANSGQSAATSTKLAIGGTPAMSVNIGNSYSFTPSVAGANGGALTFSVQNAPKWATFNTANGRLSGTPASTDAGSYVDIVISAGNGATSASLPPFSISVAPSAPAANGFTISWIAPPSSDDDDPIAIAGYRISYGTSAASLNQLVQIDDPSATSYLLSSLPRGVWYFSVSAYTSAGVSGYSSPIASTTIL